MKIDPLVSEMQSGQDLWPFISDLWPLLTSESKTPKPVHIYDQKDFHVALES